MNKSDLRLLRSFAAHCRRVLERCMDAYAAEMGRFDYAERNVLLSMRVIENHVNGIEFGVAGEDNVKLKHY